LASERQAFHVVGSERRAMAFDRTIPPVLEIDPGDTVTFETSDDSYARLVAGESVESVGLATLNAVTGPVAVRGAEPGDALRIEVLAIRIVRAWSMWLPGFGALGAYTTGLRVMQMPIEGDRVRTSDRVTVPLEPMIGCIGLAPAAGRGSTLGPVFPSGGNMDLRELSPGATLWLPVEVPGGLLSMSDIHAAMGHGEPTFVSIEAAGEATLRIGVEKGRGLAFPRLRVGEDTICVGMGSTYAAAHQRALDQAYELLTGEHGLEPPAAYTYACARVGVRFGGPAGTMVLAVVPDPTG
jgi:amidase